MSEEHFLFWLCHFPFLKIINWGDNGDESVETCSLWNKKTFATRVNQIWSTCRITTLGPYTCWKSLILIWKYILVQWWWKAENHSCELRSLPISNKDCFFPSRTSDHHLHLCLWAKIPGRQRAGPDTWAGYRKTECGKEASKGCCHA